MASGCVYSCVSLGLLSQDSHDCLDGLLIGTTSLLLFMLFSSPLGVISFLKHFKCGYILLIKICYVC